MVPVSCPFLADFQRGSFRKRKRERERDGERRDKRLVWKASSDKPLISRRRRRRC